MIETPIRSSLTEEDEMKYQFISFRGAEVIDIRDVKTENLFLHPEKYSEEYDYMCCGRTDGLSAELEDVKNDIRKKHGVFSGINLMENARIVSF